MKFSKKKITGFTDEKHEAVDDPLPSPLLPTRGFQRVTHHTYHTPHHNPPQQHDHHTTQRQTERETLGEEETKEKKTRELKREERREKIHFQCGGAWPFFVGVVIFRLIPFARETLLNSVKYDSF